MKVIENNILPPKGYKAITIGPFIFIKRGTNPSDRIFPDLCIGVYLQISLYIQRGMEENISQPIYGEGSIHESRGSGLCKK